MRAASALITTTGEESTDMSATAVEVLGIDAGGTMTDTFFVRADGEFVVGKAQSNPDNEALAIVESSRDALALWNLGVEKVFADLVTSVYSGTAMLNRVVQRKGLRVGLVVNRGMEDFHRMGRGIQCYLGYSLEDRLHLNTHRYDAPLVPADCTVGVTERVDGHGDVVIPLREAEVYTAVDKLIKKKVEAIAICLLHAHKNGDHERRVAQICREVLNERGVDIPVFASTDYYPTRKESHRSNTTIMEAYAAEPSRQTLRRIREQMLTLGGKFDLRVMASHGGTISWRAKELARTLVSGPIGGVIGSKYLGEQLGYDNIACSDIGGTSFDMALITKGEFAIQKDPHMARLLVSLPLVAMDSVGAGAGSFVRIDPYSKSIRLGPDSAGYRVGVCWAASGIDTVTVTDCHVILGYLNPDNFLGGQIKLDVERARAAVKAQVADPLGLSVEDAAAGVIELLDQSLRGHLRSMINAKGYNPIDFVCFSYGGAGPVHTYGYTQGLGFKDVVIPAWAAGFSAFGCASAEFEYRYDKSVDIAVAPGAGDAVKIASCATLEQAWRELRDKVIEEFRINGFNPEDITLKPGFSMQYLGQLNDLEIDSPLPSVASAADWERLVEAFDDTYARVYASAARSPELGFGITGAIMRGIVGVKKPQVPHEEFSGQIPPATAVTGSRPFYRSGVWKEAKLYSMEALRAGNRIVGPAVIESPATTLVVPDGWVTELDNHRLFHLREV